MNSPVSCAKDGYGAKQATRYFPRYTFVLGKSSRWAFWINNSALAVLDQGLISGSNFLISILLARWLPPEQYGAYAFAYAVFLLLSLLHQALVLEPQRVFGSSDYQHCPREYLGVLLWIHAGVTLVIFVFLGLSTWVALELTTAGSLPGALASMTFAAPCILLLWLTRGAFYVRLSPQFAVKGATIYCIVVLMSLSALYKLKLLSPFSAFLLMGLGAVASSAVLLIRLRPVLGSRMDVASWRKVTKQHWEYGRWALGSSALSWVSGDIYFVLLSSFSGMAAAGQLKVLTNFAMPPAQTFAALSTLFLPYASRLYQGSGLAALKSLTSKIAGAFGVAAIAYWVLIVVLGKAILFWLYGGRYPGLASLIPWFAAASLFGT